MARLTLYHGSQKIVEHPSFGLGNIYNDFGSGLYCTDNIELAKEWACGDFCDGYVNQYEICTDELNILDLTAVECPVSDPQCPVSAVEYLVLSWLALVLKNRKMKQYSLTADKGKEYLIKNFLPDYSGADIIIGYRADDLYFDIARLFIRNSISLEHLLSILNSDSTNKQIVVKSPMTFSRLSFIKSDKIDGFDYFQKIKERNNKVNTVFKNIDSNISETFMLDILRVGR